MSASPEPPIVIFLPSLAGGGAENVMLQLAIALKRQRIPVELWLAKASGAYLSQVPIDLPIFELGGQGVMGSLVPLVALLIRRKPRVLLSAMTHSNVVALLAARLLVVFCRYRPRIVVSERASTLFVLSEANPFQSFILLKLIRFLYPTASAIVAVSEGVAKELCGLIDLPACQVQTIHNPVSLAHWRQAACEPLLHPWFLPGQLPVLLAAGRLVLEKDFNTLLESFLLVRRQRPVRLVILGEGPLRSELEVQISSIGLVDSVALPGFSSNPMAWMARAAVFVLSSRSEGFPGVLLQAMACGAPVVSTDCPHGPREILQGGRWGELVPVGDPPAMAAAIQRQLQSDSALVDLVAPDSLFTPRPPSARCAAYLPEPIWAAYRQVLQV
jgi:glycosyltransferase involved in cell wall biosynthesis